MLPAIEGYSERLRLPHMAAPLGLQSPLPRQLEPLQNSVLSADKQEEVTGPESEREREGEGEGERSRLSPLWRSSSHSTTLLNSTINAVSIRSKLRLRCVANHSKGHDNSIFK